jgi:hypothetical protein
LEDSNANRKRQRREAVIHKIATPENAATVDAHPPLTILENSNRNMPDIRKGDAVVYWMRMGDIRGKYLN